MNEREVRDALKKIRAADRKWREEKKKFDLSVNRVMYRLIHEAAENRMSMSVVANLAGKTPNQMRILMKMAGLDQTPLRTLLPKESAEVLRKNADALGIDPKDIDLLSPLAYLPSGTRVKSVGVSGITEIPEDDQ